MNRFTSAFRRYTQERPWVILAAAVTASAMGAGYLSSETGPYFFARLEEWLGIEPLLPQDQWEDDDESGLISYATKLSALEKPADRRRQEDPRYRKVRALQRMDWTATKQPIHYKYKWHKDKVLGHGAYGSVYLATSRETKEEVALKQIPKKYTNDTTFQQEMRAMIYIRSKGGHPHLCSLHEHFDAANDYYLILDYVGGGEMFDHLIDNGAYSELEASRLLREVASALNFLHGIGLVHADLKPENLLLTTKGRGDSVLKLADFGCAQFLEHADEDEAYSFGGGKEAFKPVYGAPTPAYCPPENLNKSKPLSSSTDMWAIGVILFIMLMGCHPYDLDGTATDEEIEARILDPHYVVPLDDANVSDSAKDLVQKLMHPNPDKRLTAHELLQHPWIRGDTATSTVISGSDARLKAWRKIKTKIQAKFFESAVAWSDDSQNHEDAAIKRKTSLIERSFKAIDTEEIWKTQRGDNKEDQQDSDKNALNMSDFTNLLSDNIKHRHFPAGHVVYEEGQMGNHMYFIDSGSVEVGCEGGATATRQQGDFFGEGALLHSKGKRSATVKCKTPVHALEISREYFEKYLSTSTGSDLILSLKEKDKIRKRNRAKAILRMQNTVQPKRIESQETFFETGRPGDSIFILEEGKVDIQVEGSTVFSSYPGNIFGEHATLTGNPRNCTAKCVALEGCVAQELSGDDFRKLAASAPHIERSLRDLQLRREFKKAVVKKLKKQFPYQNPEEAFKAADSKELGWLDKESVFSLMQLLHPDISEEEIQEILDTFDLDNNGKVEFDEFKKVLIGDLRTTASM